MTAKKTMNGYGVMGVSAAFILLAAVLPGGGNFVISGHAGTLEGRKAIPFDHSHSDYDNLLRRFVQDGKVDYRGFAASRGQLDDYLDQAADVPHDAYARWNAEEKIAFWLNVYNAFTIQAILDNRPLERRTFKGLFAPEKSILQIPSVWSDPRYVAVGRKVSLEHIEHEILRKEFRDPRIHMGLVCASLGCPELPSEAFKPAELDSQLERQSTKFVNNPERGCRVDRAKGTVKVSKIFKWFGEDFRERYGTTVLFPDKSPTQRAVLHFVLVHLKDPKDREFLREGSFQLGYLKYDWSLNERER